MRTLTASDARANLYRLIDEAAESHQPIIIAGKRANAVLVSAEDWAGDPGDAAFAVGPGHAGVNQAGHGRAG